MSATSPWSRRAGGPAVAEVRRPKRPLPEFKRGRLYRRVIRLATRRGSGGVARAARAGGGSGRDLPAARPGPRPRDEDRGRGDRAGAPPRHGVLQREERVDFRDLVRDLAHELHARIEMRQIGARDTTKLMDGIGRAAASSAAPRTCRQFDPISVKMAKAQDMPLTDSRLLGNCGRLKCCLALRVLDLRGAALAPAARQHPVLGLLRRRRVHDGQGPVPPRAQAERGGGLSRTGPRPKCRSTQLTWEGRDHIKPA